MHTQAPEDWDLGLSARQDREVRAVLGQWQAQRQRLARVRMRQAAKAGGERRFLRAADGLGGAVGMMIDPESYHYWGQRLGYKCWSDAQWCREYLRDNPEARVKSRADTTTILVSGGGGLGELAATNRRFSKTYN